MGCGRLVAGRERVAGRRAGLLLGRGHDDLLAAARAVLVGIEDASGPTPGLPAEHPQPGPAGARHAALAVHQQRFPADGFNPNGADEHFGGGRFDSTPSDPYPFLYAASTDTTALAEVFLLRPSTTAAPASFHASSRLGGGCRGSSSSVR